MQKLESTWQVASSKKSGAKYMLFLDPRRYPLLDGLLGQIATVEIDRKHLRVENVPWVDEAERINHSMQVMDEVYG